MLCACRSGSRFGAVLSLAMAVVLATMALVNGDSHAKGEHEEDSTGLKVGEVVKNVELRTIDNQPIKLYDTFSGGLAVVTFYRGGWCPFCNRALKGWQDHLDEMSSLGAVFVALTPEKPAHAAETREKDEVQFAVYSDVDQAAARAFKVHFAVAPDVQKKYKGYGIDLEEANANGAWELPHPATFIVNQEGEVLWAHVDPDYARGRADPEEVIAKLRELCDGC